MSALTHANEHTLSILKQYHPPSTALEILNTRIVNKPFPLRADPIPKPTAVNPNDNRTLRRKLKKQNNRKPQPLSAKSKRELGVHAIPHSLRRSLSYEIFLPLNELWVGYAQELVALSGGAGGPAVAAKIAVGDLHGAIVKVVRSRAVDRVGIEGIVIKETRSVLEIVVKGMGLKVVPKEYTVFRFEIPPNRGQGCGSGNMVFDLHGSQFMFRATERASKKFKPKPLLDL